MGQDVSYLWATSGSLAINTIPCFKSKKKLDLINNQKMGPRKPMVSKVAETAPHIVLTRVLSSRGDQWSVLIDRMSPP